MTMSYKEMTKDKFRYPYNITFLYDDDGPPFDTLLKFYLIFM